MDTSPPSLRSTPSPISPNNFSPTNIPTPTRSASTATTRETISSASNSPTSTSQSPAEVGDFEGAPISVAREHHTLPLNVRNRILAATPGTASFNTGTRRGGVHPDRAQDLGHPAASVAAAEQKRNPERVENIPRVIHIENRDR